MTSRIRRTLLSLATVGFALSASAMSAAAGGATGPCGFCVGEGFFPLCEGSQALEMMCLTECGISQVAECNENSLQCGEHDDLHIWVECGFET